MRNNTFLEHSVFYRATTKIVATLVFLFRKTSAYVGKFFSIFSNTQAIGITAISAIMGNLLLSHIADIYILPVWVFYRIVVILLFLPWVFIKIDTIDIVRESKILQIFFKL